MLHGRLGRLLPCGRWIRQAARPSIHDAPQVRGPGDLVDLPTVIRNWWAFPAVGFNSILELKVQKFEVLHADEEPRAALGSKRWLKRRSLRRLFSQEKLLGSIQVPNSPPKLMIFLDFSS